MDFIKTKLNSTIHLKDYLVFILIEVQDKFKFDYNSFFCETKTYLWRKREYIIQKALQEINNILNCVNYYYKLNLAFT